MADSKRKLTLTQKPNAPIITWAIATVASNFLSGALKDLLELVAFGALFTWAWLEIFQGANYFRRVLGATVIGVAIYGKIQ